MSSLPEEIPRETEEAIASPLIVAPPAEPWPDAPLPGDAEILGKAEPAESAGDLGAEGASHAGQTALGNGFSMNQETHALEFPVLESMGQPEIVAPVRSPHLGHVLILFLLAMLGAICAGGLSQIGVYLHLFGVANQQDSMSEIHYTLGSEAILYLFTLAASLFVFPRIWHRSLFAGVAWRGETARRLSPLLVGGAFVCFVLALVNGWLMPGPADAPIDRMFKVPGAAWLLFGFGVTFAPFFEELVFRGFLLPALCTACDWTDETLFQRSASGPRFAGHRFWSIAAMIAIAFLCVAIPFSIFYSLTEHLWLYFLLSLAAGPAIYWGLKAIRSPQADGAVRLLDEKGQPRWSLPAMAVASLFTSIPFAGMHATQTGYSWGPFILLICVSLVLCWVRLASRSLAASVVVHACYNFMLFSFMLVGTGWFRHLDKM